MEGKCIGLGSPITAIEGADFTPGIAAAASKHTPGTTDQTKQVVGAKSTTQQSQSEERPLVNPPQRRRMCGRTLHRNAKRERPQLHKRPKWRHHEGPSVPLKPTHHALPKSPTKLSRPSPASPKRRRSSRATMRDPRRQPKSQTPTESQHWPRRLQWMPSP